jgi:hypothetical protein
MNEPAPTRSTGYQHPRGWWRRLRAAPSRIWHLLEVADDEHSPATSPRWTRRAKILWLIAFLLGLPLLLLLRPLLLRSIFHFGAAKKLKAEARERWTTNPHEALLLLKSVCLTLREARRTRRITFWRGSVVIPPHGRFRLFDSVILDDVLYSYAYALGDYEAALDVCSAPPLTKSMVEQQADCLVAMRRKADALAVLQKHLHLDNRRGDLRRRLETLSASLPDDETVAPDLCN